LRWVAHRRWARGGRGFELQQTPVLNHSRAALGSHPCRFGLFRTKLHGDVGSPIASSAGSETARVGGGIGRRAARRIKQRGRCDARASRAEIEMLPAAFDLHIILPDGRERTHLDGLFVFADARMRHELTQ